MLKKISLLSSGIALFVAGVVGIAAPAFAAVQGNVTWANFGAGPNQAPVVINFQSTGTAAQEFDLAFTGVRYNPANFVSSNANAISSASCTLGSIGALGVASSGTALSGTCSAQNPSLNNPAAQFQLVDTLIGTSTITMTFPVGSLEVTDASNASVLISAYGNGQASAGTVLINLTALTPTPAPSPSPSTLPETGAVINPHSGVMGFFLIAGGLLLAIAAKLLPKEELAKK